MTYHITFILFIVFYIYYLSLLYFPYPFIIIIIIDIIITNSLSYQPSIIQFLTRLPRSKKLRFKFLHVQYI